MTEDERIDRELDQMQRHSDQLKAEIAEAREDWEAKRHDESVAGAPTPDPPGNDGQDAREPWPDE